MSCCSLHPSLLDENQKISKERLALCEGVVDVVHIDIANNTLVPNKIKADPSEIASWNTKLKFELHLMVDNPNEVLDEWMQIGNISSVIVHAESKLINVSDISSRAQSMGWDKLIGFKIKTDPSNYTAMVEDLDPMGVLCIGIHKIGFSGQKPDIKALAKLVDNIKKEFPESEQWEWEIDAGVHEDNIEALKELGFERFVMASGIFKAKNPKQKMKSILEIL